MYQNTKPVLDIEYKIDGKTALVPEIVPTSRIGDVLSDGFGKYRVINSEPVYLDVKIPRKYDSVAIEVDYSDLNVDLFEIGVSRDETRSNFDFVTLENKIRPDKNAVKTKRASSPGARAVGEIEML